MRGAPKIKFLRVFFSLFFLPCPPLELIEAIGRRRGRVFVLLNGPPPTFYYYYYYYYLLLLLLHGGCRHAEETSRRGACALHDALRLLELVSCLVAVPV